MKKTEADFRDLYTRLFDCLDEFLDEQDIEKSTYEDLSRFYGDLTSVISSAISSFIFTFCETREDYDRSVAIFVLAMTEVSCEMWDELEKIRQQGSQR